MSGLSNPRNILFKTVLHRCFDGLEFLFWEIRRKSLIWLLSGGLFLAPILFLSEPFHSTNAGIVPFLLSPVFVAVFAPHLSGIHPGENVGSMVIRCVLFPGFTGMVFLTSLGLFGTPRPGVAVQGVVFLFSFSILISGITIGLQGIGVALFPARWTSTVIGLLLVGSFVYLSPLADHFYNRPELRQIIIGFATQVNPVLAMSGGILEQDLLRGAFLYEHLSIGRYYSYRVPSWIGLGVLYNVIGFITGGTGWVLHQRAHT